MITSVSNAKIKNVMQLNQKAKARREQGLFVAEGRKMFREAPESWIHKVYVAESLTSDETVMEQICGLPEEKAEIVADNVFRQMCDTKTPQGILTVLKLPSWSEEEVLAGENPLVMVLEDLQDPGNMGTIVRTGEAAGISGIIMSKDSADIYNPKVIRTTMGSIFRVPFAIVDDLAAAVDTLKDNGITTYAAHLKGELYNSGSLTKDCALLIGNEARGLSEEISAKADKLIKIPMHGKVESLNAAVATAILMYEAAR